MLLDELIAPVRYLPPVKNRQGLEKIKTEGEG